MTQICHFKLRDYQVNISTEANNVLKKFKIVYLAMEVRTGKTLTALNTAELYGAKKVLFLTKKKAISGIYEDYLNFKFDFFIRVVNDESIHKTDDKLGCNFQEKAFHLNKSVANYYIFV